MKYFVFAMALLVIATPSFAALGIYDLGAGAGPGGMSTDGLAVAYNLAGTNIWSSATASSANLGAAYSTVGVAYTTYNAPSGKYVVGANNGGNVYRWDGTVAGVGAWSGPLKSGTTAWAAACIGASSSNVLMGGVSGTNAYRYKESSGLLTGCTGLVIPSGGSSGSITDVSDGGGYTGRYTTSGIRTAMATNPTGGALMGLYSYPGYGPGTSGSRVFGISRDGLTAGGWSYENVSGDGGGWTGQPIVWNLSLSGGNPPIDVPLMPTYGWGSVECLNQTGSKGYGYQQVVNGSARRGTAFIWDHATNTSTDLATYLGGYGVYLDGWTLTEVVDVSGDGRVLTGYGNLGGVEHGFVVVIPEPGSLLALATGLIGFLGLRKRF